MSKTTVKQGNPYYNEGGRMPSTTGNKSGNGRGNNPHVPSNPSNPSSPSSPSNTSKGGKK